MGPTRIQPSGAPKRHYIVPFCSEPLQRITSQPSWGLSENQEQGGITGQGAMKKKIP